MTGKNVVSKTELVGYVSEDLGMSKKVVSDVLNALMGNIALSLAEGDDVRLTGFCTFSVAERAAHQCRNPQTGDMMDVPATNVVKVKIGKYLKEAVQEQE